MFHLVFGGHRHRNRLEREPDRDHMGWSHSVGRHPAAATVTSLPPAWDRGRQQSSLREPPDAAMVRCTGAGNRAHPFTFTPEQRSGLAGAEERDAHLTGGGLRALGGPGGGLAVTGSFRGAAAVPLTRKPYGYTNLFQPSFKLKSSVREEGRIKLLHHPPRIPLQQQLRTGVLSDQEAQGLRELRKRCYPVALLATMQSCQSRLALLSSGQRASAMAGDPLSYQTPE